MKLYETLSIVECVPWWVSKKENVKIKTQNDKIEETDTDGIIHIKNSY